MSATRSIRSAGRGSPDGQAAAAVDVMPLAVREAPSEALRLAACLARALEHFLESKGGAAPRSLLVGVVRTWVPRWDAAIPPVLADALIEGLVRQGRVVATRHHVGLAGAVARWRARFERYPQRLTQPADQVARECDLPLPAVLSLRVLAVAQV
jgi:hypothetical protein